MFLVEAVRVRLLDVSSEGKKDMLVDYYGGRA